MAGSRRTVGLIAGLAIIVLAVAAFGGWWMFIRDDAPEKASIDTAGKTLSEDSGGTTATTAAGAATGDVNGTWSVDKSVGSFDDFTGTWAGYRVEEQLSGIGSNTAVGRTPDVTGTMTVEGDKVTGVAVDVDLTSLQSDSGARDGALHSRGLQTDQFPTATFKLTDPVAVPGGVGDGKKVSTTAQGELTVHGVTKPVTVKIDTTLQGGKAAVVGSAPIKLTEFGIEPPTGFRVLSIKDDGTFEFQIFFAKQ
jgi:polyisoprenoid-binding protein YceI